MSIAVTVESAPSRSGTLLMAIASIAFIAVGAIAFLQFFDVFNVIAARIATGIVALLLLAYCLRMLKAAAAHGKIRLSVAENGELTLELSPIRLDAKKQAVVEEAEIVQLMPGSTLWPFFILLRLRQQNKNTIAVPFFSGCLPPQLFRRLSVACRWIAARNNLQSANQSDFR